MRCGLRIQTFCKDSGLLLEHVAPNSVHAVITDPPYGLKFMGLDWDKVLPPGEIWKRCFEALRPGGFLLSFGHPRLYHRLGLQIEDAGFEIQNCLCWGYATGTPHSLDISKQIDKAAGAEREVVAKRVHPTLKNPPKVHANFCHADTLVAHDECESWDITAPATEEAKKWEGWGTQLKAAWEPILVAQKPREGTFRENVLKWHVGAINIDECRIPYASEEDKKSLESFKHFEGKDFGDKGYYSFNTGGTKQVNVHPLGRWPANMLWIDPLFSEHDHIFMIAKPGTKEKRKYNSHPTVKPVKLMERLVVMVTPKPSVVGEDVVVLDPFMGSGTTGVACKKLGRKFIGFEMDEQNYEIARRRLCEKTLVEIGEI